MAPWPAARNTWSGTSVKKNEKETMTMHDSPKDVEITAGAQVTPAAGLQGKITKSHYDEKGVLVIDEFIITEVGIITGDAREAFWPKYSDELQKLVASGTSLGDAIAFLNDNLVKLKKEGRLMITTCPVCNGTGYNRDAVQAWDIPSAPVPECDYCSKMRTLLGEW